MPVKKVIKFGICAMKKKVGSKPMQEFLKCLDKQGIMELIVFPHDVIMNKPIEEWPR